MAKKPVLRQVAEEVDAENLRRSLTPERIKEAYRNVFTGEDGAIVLSDLKAKFNGTTVRLRPRGIDPYEVVLKEGQRQMYLFLVDQIEPPVPVTLEAENPTA